MRRPDPQREAFWRDLLTRHAASGCGVREFCLGQGVTPKQMYRWKARLRLRDQQQRSDQKPPAQAPAFLPVLVQSPPEFSPAQILIELRGGRMMHLAADMPPGQIAALVLALEGCASDPAPGAGLGAGRRA